MGEKSITLPFWIVLVKSAHISYNMIDGKDDGMKIYNTYSSSLEEFIPKHEKQVSIYVCGPTVYNHIHIGNARPVVFFDTVRRYFESLGYQVTFASNFTDVDDKIIIKAIEEGKSELELSGYYIDSFIEDTIRLGSKTDYLQPRVTEYMDSIISYIDNLVKLGYAYTVDGDVYFRVSKIEEYGKLSNRKLDDLISGARVEVNPNKESPLDFTLWKQTFEGISWESAYSKGRPGWHTECCVMIDLLFHEEIDIHGGGSDLIFPHHENEIAQSIASHNHPLARFWMHNGRLNMDGEKMSKSVGNLIWVKDLPGNPLAFRLYLLATHYRSPLNFNFEHLETYEKELERMNYTVYALNRKLDFLDATKKESKYIDELALLKTNYDEAMSLDFNTPNAITQLQALIKQINAYLRQNTDVLILNQALSLVNYMLGILGLELEYIPLSTEDKQLYHGWEKARKEKDFVKADEYRSLLQEKGIL